MLSSVIWYLYKSKFLDNILPKHTISALSSNKLRLVPWFPKHLSCRTAAFIFKGRAAEKVNENSVWRHIWLRKSLIQRPLENWRLCEENAIVYMGPISIDLRHPGACCQERTPAYMDFWLNWCSYVAQWGWIRSQSGGSLAMQYSLLRDHTNSKWNMTQDRSGRFNCKWWHSA